MTTAYKIPEAPGSRPRAKSLKAEDLLEREVVRMASVDPDDLQTRVALRDALKEFMSAERISITDFADRMGCTFKVVERWLTLRRPIPTHKLLRLPQNVRQRFFLKLATIDFVHGS